MHKNVAQDEFSGDFDGDAPASPAARSSGEFAIEAKRVSKFFGVGAREVRALDDISLAIGENEFFTLLGPSGCGKTTLLRLIAGFEHPSRGSIELHGEDISAWPPFRRPVNTVFQSYALFPHLSVARNIAFGLEMLGKEKSEIETTVVDMLRLVRMEELAERSTSQISGGQQQRVALARALAPHPRVLLLDEPLSALDLKLRKEMQVELKRLQSETGITFIFVTHDQEEALTMSDRIAVMNEGRILQVGTPRDIYDRPANRFVANFVGDTNLLEARVLSTIQGNDARLRLASGVEVAAALPPSVAEREVLTVMVRPEHVELEVEGAPGTTPARVTQTVYFGTDSLYHLCLDSGESLVARAQNLHRMHASFQAPDRVGVRLRDGSVQVLED